MRCCSVCVRFSGFSQDCASQTLVKRRILRWHYERLLLVDGFLVYRARVVATPLALSFLLAFPIAGSFIGRLDSRGASMQQAVQIR